MLTAFKILTMLWPFVKEMLFGQKKAGQILTEHKAMVAMMVLIVASVALNAFLIKRVVGISQEYLILKKHVKEVESAPIPIKEKKEIPAMITPPRQSNDSHPEVKVTPVVVTPKKKRDARRYRQLQNSFTTIQEREGKELSTPAE